MLKLNEMGFESVNEDVRVEVIEEVREDEKLSLLETLLVARYFIPIITTIGWIILYLLGTSVSETAETLCLIPITIGIISALTVSPVKFVLCIFTTAKWGMGILMTIGAIVGPAGVAMGALMGLSLGALAGVTIVVFAPAIFTIYKFFQEVEREI